MTFTCNATGNPEPTISWTRNGFPVKTSNDSSISFSEDKKLLTVTNLNRTDSAEYRCVANNSIGNDSSNVATLDVQRKYSIFLETFLERYLQCCYAGYSVQVLDQDRTMLSFSRFASFGKAPYPYLEMARNEETEIRDFCRYVFHHLTN